MGVGGWLDQVGIRLTQLSTKLKLKLKLSLAIYNGRGKGGKEGGINIVPYSV